jgi:antitoxin component of RelBE/YafQ-DinJ toxin-antitoxin module
MTVLFQCRIEKSLREKPNRVTTRLGTSTAEMFRIFVAQIAHTGKVPLNLAPEPEAGLDRARRNRVLRDLDQHPGYRCGGT